MGNIVDTAERAPKLKGFKDAELHQQIHEALKALVQADAARAKAVENIEGQYLRSLEGVADAAVKRQIAAVRKLY